MWTWTFGASIMSFLLSAARGEQPHQFGHHIRLGRVVDERALAAALNEIGASQQIQMVRERRPRNLELRLDLADGHLGLLTDEKEEDLQARGVGKRLERLNVPIGGLQPCQRDRLHISESMEIWNRCQPCFFGTEIRGR